MGDKRTEAVLSFDSAFCELGHPGCELAHVCSERRLRFRELADHTDYGHHRLAVGVEDLPHLLQPFPHLLHVSRKLRLLLDDKVHFSFYFVHPFISLDLKHSRTAAAVVSGVRIEGE